MKSYKYKYNKYKTKYLELCTIHSISNSEEQSGGDAYYNSNNGEMDPMYYINMGDDTMVDAVSSDFPYAPADFSNTSVYNSEVILYSDTEEKPVNTNIGNRGLARGTSKKEFETDDRDYTTFEKPDKSKILKIDTIDDFDNFTEKYAYVHSFKDSGNYDIQKLLLIKWNKVIKKYGGIYINGGLEADRFENAFYKGETYNSWWKYDFKMKDVIIFEKDAFDIPNPVKQTKPFKAHIYKEHEIPKEKFIDIYSEPNKKRILLILDIKDFDVFTNRYGILKQNSISIQWENVKKDYQGFYIDKDCNVYPERTENAFLDDKKYGSWLQSEKVKRKSVYVFTNKLFI